MSRFVQSHAGVIENLRPLLEAYVKGLWRGVVPRAGARVSDRAPEVERSIGPLRVHPERVAAYLELTDGADLGLARTRLLPPVFYTSFSLGPFLGVLSSGELGINLLGMVHLENELRVHRPLRMDDPVTCRVSLAEVDRTERRLLLTLLCENRVGETLASESRSRILVRLGGKGGGARSRASEEDTPDVEAFREIRRFHLAANLGRRYGLLVGDVNPIHLSPWTSRLFGFRRPIAHGFCLKALVAHALVRAHGEGDPARLGRLSIRFRGSVPLPSELLCLSQADRFLLVPPDRSQILAEGEFSLVD